MSELNNDVFVINPSGTCHSVREDHPAVALARNGREGWRLATDEERDAALRAWGQADLVPETPSTPKGKQK